MYITSVLHTTVSYQEIVVKAVLMRAVKLFINVITSNIKVDEKALIDNFTNLTKKVDFKFCELNKFFVLCCREVCGAKWCGLLKKKYNISLQNKLIHQKTKKSYG